MQIVVDQQSSVVFWFLAIFIECFFTCEVKADAAVFFHAVVEILEKMQLFVFVLLDDVCM
jgi:hypothetical protein